MVATPGPHDSTPSSVAVFELSPGGESTAQAPEDRQGDARRDRYLLQQNAKWFCHLRWIVVSFLTITGLLSFAHFWMHPLGLELAPAWMLTIAAILTVANLVHTRLLRNLPEDATSGRVRVLLWTQIVLDLAILTAVIHFLGSGVRYAPMTYLFHIILACIFFHRWESLGVIVVSALLILGLVCLESMEIVSPTAAVIHDAGQLTGAIAWGGQAWQLGSLLGIWIIIWYLVARLSGQLREREHELIATNQKLKASSEERSRHMLQTTHELKAPFAAIHASTQLLLGNYAGPLSEQSRTVVEKIAARAQILSQLIQEMLQLANLRSQSQSPPTPCLLDLRRVMRNAVERLETLAALRSVTIEAELESIQVHSVDDYLTMLISNLLHNAVTYSLEGGQVLVACRRDGPTTACVIVQDHGIGIPADKLPLVFQDYYRTMEAARHNRASTGLGLAIVRLVARALQISLRIESAPGWGTRITLQMPAVENPTSTRSQAYQGE